MSLTTAVENAFDSLPSITPRLHPRLISDRILDHNAKLRFLAVIFHLQVLTNWEFAIFCPLSENSADIIWYHTTNQRIKGIEVNNLQTLVYNCFTDYDLLSALFTQNSKFGTGIPYLLISFPANFLFCLVSFGCRHKYMTAFPMPLILRALPSSGGN